MAKDILITAIFASLPVLFFYCLGFIMGRKTTSKEVKQLLSRPTQRAADGACTCLYEVGGDDMSLDPDCPVHGSPRR